MWDEIKTALSVLLIVMSVMVALLAPTAGIYVLQEAMYCNKMEVLDPNHEYMFNVWTGCITHLEDNTWVNASEYLNKERFEIEVHQTEAK